MPRVLGGEHFPKAFLELTFATVKASASSSIPFKSPNLNASSTSNISAVRKYRLAAFSPILEITKGEIVAGVTPNVTSESLNLVPVFVFKCV